MTLDSNFVDVWAYPICCTAGMQNDTLSRDAFQEEQNTTYHFAAWHNLDWEKMENWPLTANGTQKEETREHD